MNKKVKDGKKELRKKIEIFVTLFGILGTVLTIYSVITQNKKPNLICEVLSDSNVFDINRDISDLKITYREKDLQENNKKLAVIQLKFSNNGTDVIKTDSFDNSYPLTVKISNGIIIDKPILELASNKYLEEIILFDVTENEIKLPSFIFDEQDFFIFSFLILCDSADKHSIDVTGKIAKQKEIDVITYKTEVESLSFFKNVFSGNIFIQLVRLFLYTLITIFFVFILWIIIYFISEKVEKLKRKREIEKFISEKTAPNNQTNKLIYDYYITNNFVKLKQVYLELKENHKDISTYVTDALKKKISKEDRMRQLLFNDTVTNVNMFLSLSLVIKDTETKYIINKTQYKLLAELIEYLNERHSTDGEFPFL